MSTDHEHPSHSGVQGESEAIVLAYVAEKLGVELQQGVKASLDEATIIFDGATHDESVLVEVFSRIGKLKGAQLHKVSTDTLKLLAARETRPDATLVLGFADQEAADSIVGWRRAVLKRSAIRVVVAELTPDQREAILAAQLKQKHGMAG